MSLKIIQTAQPKNQRYWSWSVWLEGTQNELNDVQEVVWKLHPTFLHPIRRVTSRHNGFRLDSSGWGEFEITAEIHALNGQVDNLRRWLRFERDFAPVKETRVPSRVFLSYTRSDARLAGALAKELRGLGVEVFLDVDIPTGVDLRSWVLEKIQESNALVIFVSKEELNSMEISRLGD